jgi:fatty acid desaturase
MGRVPARFSRDLRVRNRREVMGEPDWDELGEMFGIELDPETKEKEDWVREDLKRVGNTIVRAGRRFHFLLLVFSVSTILGAWWGWVYIGAHNFRLHPEARGDPLMLLAVVLIGVAWFFGLPTLGWWFALWVMRGVMRLLFRGISSSRMRN